MKLFNLKKHNNEPEPDQEIIETENYDLEIKPNTPKKSKSRFKRGTLVLCLILSPGERRGEFKNLRKEETLLIDKPESQKFLIVAPPALELSFKNKTYPVYVCDAEKGVTISLSIDRERELAALYCDPHMISNIFDETFISKASNIKADWKQLVGIGCGSLVFGLLLGLMF